MEGIVQDVDAAAKLLEKANPAYATKLRQHWVKLRSQVGDAEHNELKMDLMQVLYWFCTDLYEGQADPLYQLISVCGYRPGPEEKGVCSLNVFEDLYDDLSTIAFLSKANG